MPKPLDSALSLAGIKPCLRHSLFMKSIIIGCIVGLIGLAGCSIQVRYEIKARYEWERDYAQLWNLSDKASTIEAKKKLVGQFVEALESGHKRGAFSSHNAKWLKQPDNSFASNLEALKTLRDRLNEIGGMNPSSFEYNTAMQQITEQEQGGASAMLGTINGCWKMANYFYIWSWVGTCLVALFILMIFIGFATAFASLVEL